MTEVQAMATLQRPRMAKRLSWQDMSPSSPRIHLTRRIVQLQNDKTCAEILEQAKQICNEYVEAKLERQGIKNRSLSFAFSSGTTTNEKMSIVSNRIQEVGELLEECYPRLYTDISSHVNVPFSSENAVHEVFNNVSSEILSEGITWARIVALFAFAGALVADCCKEGRNSFVLDIGNWMYEFAALYMVDWIRRKGGWEDLLRVFPCSAASWHGSNPEAKWSRCVATVGEWCASVFYLIRYCYTAYLDQVRKLQNVRKTSKCKPSK